MLENSQENNSHVLNCQNLASFSRDAIVLDTSNRKLLSLISILLNDDRQIMEVARQSYRHQLGFLKFSLINEGGKNLRLHFWDEQLEGLEDIHSHCANFHSRIVLGSLTENCYDLVCGNSHSRFRYQFNSIEGHSEAIADGFTSVHLKGRRVLLEGETYMKKSFELHNVHNVAKGTITISAWNVRDREALVLKEPNAHVNDCMVNAGMQPSDVKNILQKIMKRIQNNDITKSRN